MSFTLLMAVTAAVAAGAGYFAAKKGPKDARKNDKDKERDNGGGEKKNGEKKKDDLEAAVKKKLEKDKDKGNEKPKDKKKNEKAVFDALPLALGDVVTGEGEERWLAGAVVMREDGKVLGALFLAPEGSENRAVVAFARPRRDIYWLKPTPLDTPDEPPATIEVEQVALRRKGRIPVSMDRLGQGAPPVVDSGVFATYDGGGREVAVVVTSGGRAWAWVGLRLEEQDYERLGGGGD